MKLFSTFITLTLLFYAPHSNCMEKKKTINTPAQQANKKLPSKTVTKSPEKSSKKLEKKTSNLNIPSTTSPEFKNLSKNIAELKKEVNELRTQVSLSVWQLNQLHELALKQEENMKIQGEKLALLFTVIKYSCSSPLEDAGSTTCNSPIPTFTPMTNRTWPEDLNNLPQSNIWGSPNHPRPTDNMPTLNKNPWESPNHPRDK